MHTRNELLSIVMIKRQLSRHAIISFCKTWAHPSHCDKLNKRYTHPALRPPSYTYQTKLTQWIMHGLLCINDSREIPWFQSGIPCLRNHDSLFQSFKIKKMYAFSYNVCSFHVFFALWERFLSMSVCLSEISRGNSGKKYQLICLKQNYHRN